MVQGTAPEESDGNLNKEGTKDAEEGATEGATRVDPDHDRHSCILVYLLPAHARRHPLALPNILSPHPLPALCHSLSRFSSALFFLFFSLFPLLFLFLSLSYLPLPFSSLLPFPKRFCFLPF